MWKCRMFFRLWIKKGNYLSELAELGGSNCCFFTDADILNNWKLNYENVQNDTDGHVFIRSTHDLFRRCCFFCCFCCCLSIGKGSNRKESNMTFFIQNIILSHSNAIELKVVNALWILSISCRHMFACVCLCVWQIHVW